MQVNIHSEQVKLDKAIEAHIQRKIKLALSRFESSISSISISLSDDLTKSANTSNSDITATRCCLKVFIGSLTSIEVEDTQNDLYCAIDRVIQKASRSIPRKLSSPATNSEM